MLIRMVVYTEPEKNFILYHSHSGMIFDTFATKHNTTMILFGLPGGAELIIIVFVVLLLFGGKKIPELARGLGKGIREFNSARASIEQEIQEGIKEKEKEEVQSKA